jgi:hypothetical protein
MAGAVRHREPTLNELLDEPIVQLIMKRDGVAPEMMRKQITRLAAEQRLAESA